MLILNTYKEEIDCDLWYGYQEIAKDLHKVYFEVLDLVVLYIVIFEFSHILINVFK
jgi:hypothetical protein